MKGLACTAKCMGDAQCTVGCFARYGNKVLDAEGKTVPDGTIVVFPAWAQAYVHNAHDSRSH